MSYLPTAPRPATGMAKGAAVAALVYFGLILLALEALILLGGTFLSALIREAEDYSGSVSLTTGSVVAMLAIALVIVFAFPIGLAVWMLLGAVKDSPVNVLVPLIVFSVFSGLSLLATLVSRGNDGSVAGAGIGLNLPWYAILIFSWVGWARMNNAHKMPGVNSRDPSGYQGYPSQALGQPAQDSGCLSPNPAYPAQAPGAPYGAAPPQPEQPASSYPAPQWQTGTVQRNEPNRPAADDTTPYEQSEPTRRLPPPEAWPLSTPGWDEVVTGELPPAPGTPAPPVADPQPPDDEPTVDQRSPWARPDDRSGPDESSGTR